MKAGSATGVLGVDNTGPKEATMIGIGLRHPHIESALSSPGSIDFVEVHAENYFAEGGLLHHVLRDVADKYPVSLHGTAMGLGSAAEIPRHYLEQLVRLASVIDPFLISDHAAFGWGELSGKSIQAGDLLPISYNAASLKIFTQRVDQVQQLLGRQILVENLSYYLSFPDNTMTEAEFLVELSTATGCGLLLDLNNILVNAFNEQESEPIAAGETWLQQIPAGLVGEIHLAGYTPPLPGQLAIDDHAQPVDDTCWKLYAQAIKRFGPIPTLIEWDNNLPSWEQLTEQAMKAKRIAQENRVYEPSKNPTT